MNGKLHDIFEIIDQTLWDAAEASVGITCEKPLLRRVNCVERQAQAMKQLIGAYIEKREEMMRALIMDERFAKFPLPNKKELDWVEPEEIRSKVPEWAPDRFVISGRKEQEDVRGERTEDQHTQPAAR